MVFYAKDSKIEIRQRPKDGEGEVQFEAFVDKADMPKHIRMFSDMVFKPGCSIGKHYHNGESEFYYVVEGEATVDDNGTTVVLKKGDVSLCPDGCYHSIKNCSEGMLRVLGVIVTEA